MTTAFSCSWCPEHLAEPEVSPCVQRRDRGTGSCAGPGHLLRTMISQARLCLSHMQVQRGSPGGQPGALRPRVEWVEMAGLGVNPGQGDQAQEAHPHSLPLGALALSLLHGSRLTPAQLPLEPCWRLRSGDCPAYLWLSLGPPDGRGGKRGVGLGVWPTLLCPGVLTRLRASSPGYGPGPHPQAAVHSHRVWGGCHPTGHCAHCSWQYRALGTQCK